jgi:mevalonate kinase
LGAFLGAAVSVYGAVFAVDQQAKKREALLFDALQSVAMRPWSEAQTIVLMTDLTHSSECIDQLSKLLESLKNAQRASERIAQGLIASETEEVVYGLGELIRSTHHALDSYKHAASTDSFLNVGKSVVRKACENIQRDLEFLRDKIKYRDVS